MQQTSITTNASAAKTAQTGIRIVNGMQCVRVERGVWQVLETKAGHRTGRTTFTGTIREIESI